MAHYEITYTAHGALHEHVVRRTRTGAACVVRRLTRRMLESDGHAESVREEGEAPGYGAHAGSVGANGMSLFIRSELMGEKAPEAGYARAIHYGPQFAGAERDNYYRGVIRVRRVS